MAGSQKVFLRIVGLIGDSDDPDEMPDRVNVSGRGRLVPTIATGAGDVAQGPDSLHEIRLIEPVPFEIIDGMLTYNAKPYVWLPVPTGEWMWRITFEQIRIGESLRELRDFTFPLDAATPAQIADEGYPGVNLAQYGIGAWEPGTVNLTAEAIQQITIYLGRASNAAGDAEGSASAAASSAAAAEDSETAAKASETAAKASETAAKASETAAKASETAAKASETAAKTSETAAKTSETNAETARTGAETARTGAETARTGAESARDAAAGSASDAADSAAAAAGSASDADESKVQAQFARSGAEAAASAAADHRQVAESASVTAQNARGQAQNAASVASGHASDAAASAAAAADERVVAQDAAALAEGHAATADGHRVDAEAAAALAQSLRWVVKGAWSPGSYEAGDVVVYDERAYYAQTATSVEPPAQPWVPLTPASGGASHWDDLDGKPTAFPPEAHTHDAEDVSGAATPLLDVTEASVGAQSVGEALDATTDASRLEGALTGQVDASGAMVTYTSPERPGQTVTNPIVFALEYANGWYGAAQWLDSAKADVDHTHDGADITGALTDQANVGEALFAPPGDAMEDMTVLQFVQAMLSEFGKYALTNHKHPVADIEATGTPAHNTYLRGDGSWSIPPNNTYSTPSQAEAEAGTATAPRAFSAQRVRQAANAAISAREWTGTQAQYDALGSYDPDTTYYVIEE